MKRPNRQDNERRPTSQNRPNIKDQIAKAVANSAVAGCGCRKSSGGVEPIASPPFYWNAIARWDAVTHVLEYLQSIPGFQDITAAHLEVEFNNASAWDSPVYVRVCDEYTEDEYIAQLTQEGTGWKWTYSIVGGASRNCDDEVLIVLRSADNAIYADRTNRLYLDQSETPKPGTAGYVDASGLAGCAFCLNPWSGTVATVICGSDGYPVPANMRGSFALSAGGTEEVNFDIVFTNVDGANLKVCGYTNGDIGGPEIYCGGWPISRTELYLYVYFDLVAETIKVWLQVTWWPGFGGINLAWRKDDITYAEWDAIIAAGYIILDSNVTTSGWCTAHTGDPLTLFFDPEES